MQPVRFLKDADHVDLAELYQRHAPALMTHLRLNVSSIEYAEDLLLDIFVAALEHKALRGISLDEQRFWLWRVARNPRKTGHSRTHDPLSYFEYVAQNFKKRLG